MATEIGARLAESNPLCLCVMNGGVVPTGQLLPRLDFPLQLDYLHVTRYRGETRGGDTHWLREPGLPLVGRTILVIDDILDQGLTLAAIVAHCQAQGAREVYTAVLADKQAPRAPGGLARADFTGLRLPDRYVFGYGLDYREYWRNAPGIYAVAYPEPSRRENV
jgi:hypoxanthine phosphoribosyltransferase